MHSESAPPPIPSEHIIDCFCFLNCQTCVLPVWRLHTLMHPLFQLLSLEGTYHRKRCSVKSKGHTKGAPCSQGQMMSPGWDKGRCWAGGGLGGLSVIFIHHRGEWWPWESKGRSIPFSPRGPQPESPPKKYLHMWEEQVCPYEEKSWWIAQNNGSVSLTSLI